MYSAWLPQKMCDVNDDKRPGGGSGVDMVDNSEQFWMLTVRFSDPPL